jgi:acetyl esterase/lipase
MAKVGPKWAEDTRGHIRLMLEEFSKVLVASPKQGVVVERDVAYGGHQRQTLDLFSPPALTIPGPAVIFVHGGAFTEGTRRRTEEIYDNVLFYFARNGIVGVNAGYRLAPEARYPEATRDVASVVTWTRRNASRLNIDPDRVFLMGHSAGGAHVASYAYDKRHHGEDGHALAGLLIVSGRVRADNRRDNPNAHRVAEYYGDDDSLYEDRSPVSHISRHSVRTLIAMAEFENPLIDLYCCELAYRLTAAKGYAPPLYWLKGHNHTSIIAHFNTAEDLLGRACCDFIFRGELSTAI